MSLPVLEPQLETTLTPHEDELCTVCRYPRTDGKCQNPVCGETEQARERFAAAAVVRQREATALAERQHLMRISFGTKEKAR